jgi:hypothetical protein
LLLSPSEEAVICEGEELELICTTNATFLQWSWSLQIEQGEVHKYSRYISSTDVSQQMSSVSVNSTLFQISRASHQGRLPLVSRLLVNPMNTLLNGTIKVNCTELGTNAEMGSINIYIMGACKYTIIAICNTIVINFTTVQFTLMQSEVQM